MLKAKIVFINRRKQRIQAATKCEVQNPSVNVQEKDMFVLIYHIFSLSNLINKNYVKLTDTQVRKVVSDSHRKWFIVVKSPPPSKTSN